jgi:hypothetical protein
LANNLDRSRPRRGSSDDHEKVHHSLVAALSERLMKKSRPGEPALLLEVQLGSRGLLRDLVATYASD